MNRSYIEHSGWSRLRNKSPYDLRSLSRIVHDHRSALFTGAGKLYYTSRLAFIRQACPERLVLATYSQLRSTRRRQGGTYR